MSMRANKAAVQPEAGKRQERRATSQRCPRRVFSAVDAMTALQTQAGNHTVVELLGAGRPLPPAVRADMEKRFGTGFADVRVHDDARSRESADALGANAYTHGNHLVFGSGRLEPGTAVGRRLLAHELAHVVQQRRGGSPPALDPAAHHEHAAESAARAAVDSDSVPVAVSGATGVGIAADWKDWVKSKASEYVPDEVKEIASEVDETVTEYKQDAEAWVDETVDEYVPQEVQDAASTAAGVADILSGPTKLIMSPGSVIDDTVTELRDAMFNDLVEAATGEDMDAPGVREVVRDQSLEGIGMAKGVALQGAGMVDTLLWAGNELRDLQEGLIRTTARAVGMDEEQAVAASRQAPALPIGGGLESLAELGDLMQEYGLVDAQGNPSLAAPVAEGYDILGKKAEEAIGAPPSDDDSFFTPMEIGELKGALAVSAGLAAVGVKEVQIAVNAVGALSGLRDIVESARNDPGWRTSARFWGGIVGTVLSVAGIVHGGAAGASGNSLVRKITTYCLKYGWIGAAAVPMGAMISTYLDGSLSEEERDKRMKQHYMQVIHVLKDAVLHIAQAAQSGKPPPRPGKSAAAPLESKPPPTRSPLSKTRDKGAQPTPAPAPAAERAAIQPLPRKASPVLESSPAPKRGAVTPSRPKAKAMEPSVVAAPRGKADASGAATPAKASTGNKPKRTSKPKRKAGRPVDPEVASHRQDVRAGKAEAAAAKLKDDVKSARDFARERSRIADKAKTLAERQRAEANKRQDTARQAKEAAARETDPVRQQRLEQAAVVAAKKAKAARAKADASESRANRAKQKETDAKAKLKETRRKSRNARRRATNARKKAEAMRLPPDPKTLFDDDPAFASAPRAALPQNSEPVVWVRTGSGSKRGTFIPEGHPDFGQGDGIAMPMSQAAAYPALRPAASNTPQAPTKPRIDSKGRQLESAGASGNKSGKLVTAQDPDAVRSTTIRAGLREKKGHDALLEQGELGIKSPIHPNQPGVDSITAKVPLDADGKPIPGKAEVYLNDFTSADAGKGPKPSHADWYRELVGTASRKAPAGERLDLNDPLVEQEIRSAIGEGRVKVRVIRVDDAAPGPGGIRVDSSESWPASVPWKRPRR